MLKLKLVSHPALTNDVLKVLSQSRITTFLEFLQEDTEKLSFITKMSLPDILTLRTHIFNTYSAPVLNGAALYKKIKTKKKYVQTGLERLNLLLDGGIALGCITEVCGLADSGKTQLCLQLAIDCVKATNGMVLYVDTKGDFSAMRVQKILEAEGLSHKDMAIIMYKIKVVHAWTMDETIELLKKIKNKTLAFEDLSLIIVDSLPCLMFQYLGDNNKIGLALLNTFVNYCRFISNHMELGVICVNLQTRWVDQDFPDLDEDERDQSTSTIKEAAYVERRNRCLGNYWRHVPAVVLLLEKSQSAEFDNNHTSSLLKVTKMKPMGGRNLHCNLILDTKGVM